MLLHQSSPNPLDGLQVFVPLARFDDDFNGVFAV